MQKWKILQIKIICTLSLSFLLNLVGFSQDLIRSNKDIIFAIKDQENKKIKRVRTYVYKKQKSFIKKYNPISLTFGSLLYFYQNALSPQFSADCLFHPTCSDFSKQAIQEYGIFKGVFLSADRITRCNRIAATSIHPLKFNEHNHHADDEIKLYKFR